MDRPTDEKGGVTFRVHQNTIPAGAGRKETPPMLRIVETDVEREEESGGSLLDELAREGARRMLVKALET